MKSICKTIPKIRDVKINTNKDIIGDLGGQSTYFDFPYHVMGKRSRVSLEM